MTSEQPITELYREIDRLKEELEQAQKDISDFEVLAIEWKRGYADMKNSYEIKLKHAEQIIEELREELEEELEKDF